MEISGRSGASGEARLAAARTLGFRAIDGGEVKMRGRASLACLTGYCGSSLHSDMYMAVVAKVGCVVVTDCDAVGGLSRENDSGLWKVPWPGSLTG